MSVDLVETMSPVLLATACEADRGLCDRFVLLIHIYIYLFSS